jgi:phosphate transport system substrate-binding protein
MKHKRNFLKAMAVAAFATLGMGSAMAADITGAGATFPFPIYAKWAEAYKKATGTGLNYQSIGSSGGIRQIRAKTVAFGASDAPVPGADLDKDGMVQFPAIIGGTVPVINLDGFKPGELRVTGPVLAEMFLGKVVKWNDAKLVALNPGKTLDRLPDGGQQGLGRHRGQGRCREVACTVFCRRQGQRRCRSQRKPCQRRAGLCGVRLCEEEQHELPAAAERRRQIREPG